MKASRQTEGDGGKGGKLIGVVHPGYFGRDPRSGKRRDRHDRGRDSEPFLKAGKRPKGGEGTWFGVAAWPMGVTLDTRRTVTCLYRGEQKGM